MTENSLKKQLVSIFDLISGSNRQKPQMNQKVSINFDEALVHLNRADDTLSNEFQPKIGITIVFPRSYNCVIYVCLGGVLTPESLPD
jgi:hypothetical protein